MRLEWTCSITLCMSGEYGGSGTLSWGLMPISSRASVAELWMWGLSYEYNRSSSSNGKLSFLIMRPPARRISFTMSTNSGEVVPFAGSPLEFCKKGRPKKLFQDFSIDLMDDEATGKDFWVAEKNQDIIALEDVGVACAKQCHLHCLCFKHTCFKTIRAVTQNWTKGHKTALDCNVCNVTRDSENGRSPSRYERIAYAVCSRFKYEFIFETRVLGENYSSADIFISECKLVIMIDGEGHFGKMYGLPGHQQSEIDERFNAAALKAGISVLRLAFVDWQQFKENIPAAVEICKSGHPPCVMKSDFHRLVMYANQNKVSDKQNNRKTWLVYWNYWNAFER